MRVAASIAVTALLTTTLSACAFVTPQQTSRSYTPSDGVNGSVGTVAIRNVFLVTADGASASLIGVLSNRSDAEKTVTLQFGTASGTQSTEVTVPADGLVSLRPGPDTLAGADGTTTQQVTLDGIDAQRGGLFPVSFASGAAEPVDLRLPVLTTSLSEYATLTPTPTPTPTRTRRPIAQDAPEPSDSATPSPTETTAG